MAIEFHCPYCTASIRVPDQHAGKKGSCPKCATKLVVPTLPGAPMNQPPPPTVQPSADSPAATSPASSGSPDQQPVEQQGEVFTNPQMVPQAESPVLSADEVPQFASAPGTSSIARRLKKKRRRKKSQMLFAIGIPLICLLVFFGITVAIVMNRESPLTGTLAARELVGHQIPAAAISVANFGLTADESTAVLTGFGDDPEAFISDQIQCRISAVDRELQIRLQAGKDFEFFAVDTSKHTPLMVWARNNRPELNRRRSLLATKAGTDLCRDKLSEVAGESVIYDAIRYRNDFGLNVHSDGLGFAVEAVTNQRLSRCVHEDGMGVLYFCLPRGTKSFVVKGRILEGGEPVFPGEFTVNVVETVSEPKDGEASEQQVDDEPADTESEAMEPDSEMTPDSNPGSDGNEADPEMKMEPETS